MMMRMPPDMGPGFGAIAAVADDFSFEIGPDLSSREAHDFLGAEAQCAMAKQSREKVSGFTVTGGTAVSQRRQSFRSASKIEARPR